MSGAGVDGHEMERLPELDDATADSLLSCRAVPGEPEVADVLGDLRVAFRSVPAPAPGPELAALLAGVQAGGADPAATRRRRVMLGSALSTMAARVAVGFAAAAAATGGLASAHALPGPAQEAVADVAGVMGVDLHDGDEASDEVVAPEPETDPDSTTTTTTTSVPGAGTDGDGEGEHPDNHGRAVSEVAHSDEHEGCEHGAAVSGVARSNGKGGGNEGKEHPECPDDDSDDDGDDDNEVDEPTTSVPEPEEDDDLDEPDTSVPDDEDDDDGSGHGRGRGHGRDGAED